MYSLSTLIIGIGVTYAAVPLYRAFCSATGFGARPWSASAASTRPASFPRTSTRLRAVRRGAFASHSTRTTAMRCVELQAEPGGIYVLPGETALAFYKAKNDGNKDITGIATYNVSPDRIAPYFAKIECFCFEEQRLLAHEEVDLPVFFFIDADVLDDPNARDVRDVVLSYSFLAHGETKRAGSSSQTRTWPATPSERTCDLLPHLYTSNGNSSSRSSITNHSSLIAHRGSALCTVRRSRCCSHV
ncbi:hypothetical protein L7F22_052263 [Adiantum nelumboides]|nr:hypothetical protein [Adiantum nelumboides]